MIESLPISLTSDQIESLRIRYPQAWPMDARECGVCISSRAYRDPAGHSRVSVGGRVGMLHRYIYAATNGPIPGNMLVLHRCGNAWCINPTHLYLGDAKQNMVDRREHGRGLDGEKNMKAKLTWGDVEEIRTMAGRQVDIAAKFGVSQAAVSKIKLGITWVKPQK